jgi:pimeloyl-ACP methyl ester carboxylesterase
VTRQQADIVYDFRADDGAPLRLRNVRSIGPAGDPVVLIHGAGVRSNLFRPPTGKTVVEALSEAGHDVWLFDWRASIEHAPNEWTLDDAAVHDHPAAIRKILELTGRESVKAIIHCQGSTSFMKSLVAGLLPDVSLVISNAVALHPVVPWRSLMKSRYALPLVGRFIKYLNPQWGISAPAGVPTLIDWFVRATHHECNNAVCKHSSFVYGSGFPTLWRHENLDDATHEWLKGEFAHVPLSFFREMAMCIKAGHLVSTGKYPQLPQDFIAAAPRTEARLVFLAGQFNDCFSAESQARTFDFVDHHAPGRHAFYELAGYGHLDVFIGKNAAIDVFPLIIDELRRG